METIHTVDAEGNPITVDEPVERDNKYVMIVYMVGFPAVYTGFREGTREERMDQTIIPGGPDPK